MKSKKPEFDMAMTTEEEREQMAMLLSEMIRDYVYAHSEDRARMLIRKAFNFNMNVTDTLHVEFSIEVNGGLLNSFRGKIRRKKKEGSLS